MGVSIQKKGFKEGDKTVKKHIYETPEIEFTKFEMEMKIMNGENETTNGDIIHIGETTAASVVDDETVEDL